MGGGHFQGSRESDSSDLRGNFLSDPDQPHPKLSRKRNEQGWRSPLLIIVIVSISIIIVSISISVIIIIIMIISIIIVSSIINIIISISMY